MPTCPNVLSAFRRMLPTLRQMQYFVALAEHRSFGRAARACHVTQSTLSGAIRQFEACLGAELVDRSGKVLSLTEAGESVLVRAGAILRETEDMAAHARIAAAPLSGRLRLGVIPSIAPFLLPQALPALRAAQRARRLRTAAPGRARVRPAHAGLKVLGGRLAAWSGALGVRPFAEARLELAERAHDPQREHVRLLVEEEEEDDARLDEGDDLVRVGVRVRARATARVRG